ncbi:MAG TPA: hypothetical protein VF219_08155, partial [Vicinamibacterales bacterium]
MPTAVSLAGGTLAKAGEDIRDIRGPKALPGSWLLPAVLVGALLVTLCIAYAIWRRSHRQARPLNPTLLEQTLER